MASRRDFLLLAAVGTLAAAGGAYLATGRFPGIDTGVAGLLDVPVRDLDGRLRRIVEWKGRILVCNFWATWCAPCREEIPALGRLRAKFSSKGLEIVGIAIDQAAKVAEFVKVLEIAYPVLLADPGALERMKKLGNPGGGLPFTVVLDRQGNLVHRQLGPITEADFERRLASIV